MPKIKKGNRVLTVEKGRVSGFLKDGYDEIDEKGKVINKATGGKTISIGEYNKVLAELDKAKAAGSNSEELEGLKTKIKELEEDISAYEKETEELEATIEKLQSAEKDNSKPAKK